MAERNVMEDLLRGKAVHLRGEAYGTDCYPRREIDKDVTLADLPDAIMLNPRNCYQNYNAAVNLTSRTIYTYMGAAQVQLRQLQLCHGRPAFPRLSTTRITRPSAWGPASSSAGSVGYVIGEGTQHVSKPQRNDRGIPENPSGTLMLKGDFKKMKARYVRAQSILGYGVSLAVGVGIPIPMLNEEMALLHRACPTRTSPCRSRITAMTIPTAFPGTSVVSPLNSFAAAR